MKPDERLDELVTRVLASAKYQHIQRDVVARVGATELAAGHTLKDAIKSTRRKLHQIGAVYLSGRRDYGAALALLREAQSSGQPAQTKEACRTIMRAHQSSRERISILESFYQDLFAPLAPVKSVLDLACGLNPLSIPWMPLTPGARYHALDIFHDLMAFLWQAMPLLGVQGSAEVGDVLAESPATPADVALLLKSVPCLELIERNAGERIVASVPARHVVVSFPTASLGGRRDRGMLATYRRRMEQICAQRVWTVREHLYDSELAYVIDKAGPAGGGSDG